MKQSRALSKFKTTASISRYRAERSLAFSRLCFNRIQYWACVTMLWVLRLISMRMAVAISYLVMVTTFLYNHPLVSLICLVHIALSFVFWWAEDKAEYQRFRMDA